MAIWQFELLFIPRQRVICEFGAPETQMSAVQWDSIDWWSQHQPPSDFQSRIAAVLPAYDSWSSDILMWGAEDSDRIHVCLDEAHARVEEVSVRLDLRRPCQQFAHAISDLAKHADCVLAAWPHHTFEPSFERLMSEISGSESARFVHAPREYFEELARDPNKEARGWTRS
jgi:hypothetical protein